ncbi:MAG: anthranilate synthase component I family protein [Flavobacteriaceae bacterium]|nr:anthranilate synthase component I family protein [Flavobacteriaceae bacterium]
MKHKITTQYKKVLADIHTPVCIYNSLRDQFSNALLLEAVDYHDRSDCKSFICLEPIAGFESKANAYTYNLPNERPIHCKCEDAKDVFKAFENFATSFVHTPTDLPFAIQGLWGYSSFEAVQYVEDITFSSHISDLKDNPDLKYQCFKYVLIFDHFKNELFITNNSYSTLKDHKKSIQEIETILGLIQVNNTPNFSFSTYDSEVSNLSDEDFEKMVEKGIQHCENGDTFQLVLSREFRQKFKGDEFNLYRCLRSINPSPYLYFFDYGDFKIFGSSPESQIQVVEGKATITPIAGTLLRGNSQDEDLKGAEKLKQNPKEMSEHVMLVDLARNDLSKNSEEVKVENYAEIQYFSHVIHMVSKVSGKLLKDKSGLNIYADTFPAGTLSGAPKYRALEIIAATENTSRNFYGGSIGFFGFDGSVNHAIIIRSVLSKNNTIIYQAGAGIVADSNPKGELQEVNNKVAAIRKAIENANAL